MWKLIAFNASTLVLAICGFLLSFAVSLQAHGLKQGLEIGDANLEEYRAQRGDEIIRFSGGVEPTYQKLARDYGVLSFSFLCLSIISGCQLFIKRFRKIGTFPGACLAIALFPIYLSCLQIRDKRLIEDFVLDAPRNAFLKVTVTYDWMFLVLAISIATLSVFLVVFTFRLSRSHINADLN